MEGLGNVLAYLLLNGKLPWMRIKADSNKMRYEKVKEIKDQVEFEELFEDFP